MRCVWAITCSIDWLNWLNRKLNVNARQWNGAIATILYNRAGRSGSVLALPVVGKSRHFSAGQAARSG
jgi:hypothetical protein